jgi:TolA-binding protein
MRKTIFVFAAVAALAPFIASGQPLVQSQEGIALENQILQLQNQVQQLQASGAGNSSGSALGNSAPPLSPAPSGSTPAPSSDIVASLLNQVSQLQAQVQQLSGRIDTLQNQVDTQNAATQKAIGDLNFKVTGGAGTTGAPGPATIPAPSGPGAPLNLTAGTLGTTPAAPAAAASPATALQAAQAALARRDYATAEANARTVLANARSSPEGYKAQYILAESLYGENRPQDAAIAFDDAYNRDRTGANAPGALLGLANSLTDIQQSAAACDTLSSLNSQFPTPPPGMAPQIQAAEQRASCN